ncbi:hypothetical protein E2C01_020038 [Portunus trituberculatus]|uniref:Uncharacterized protein n=1 Tax=Portunus trituberculatus TaxID=210409 RepID=A0A5B7E0N3_PORTR|nr:hypothetical protein [Portunus trituberculatus]
MAAFSARPRVGQCSGNAWEPAGRTCVGPSPSVIIWRRCESPTGPSKLPHTPEPHPGDAATENGRNTCLAAAPCLVCRCVMWRRCGFEGSIGRGCCQGGDALQPTSSYTSSRKEYAGVGQHWDVPVEETHSSEPSITQMKCVKAASSRPEEGVWALRGGRVRAVAEGPLIGRAVSQRPRRVPGRRRTNLASENVNGMSLPRLLAQGSGGPVPGGRGRTPSLNASLQVCSRHAPLHTPQWEPQPCHKQPEWSAHSPADHPFSVRE